MSLARFALAAGGAFAVAVIAVAAAWSDPRGTMSLGIELLVMLLLTYGVGMGIGRLLWKSRG